MDVKADRLIWLSEEFGVGGGLCGYLLKHVGGDVIDDYLKVDIGVVYIIVCSSNVRESLSSYIE